LLLPRHLFRRDPNQSQLETDLSFEVLKSERIRAFALMCILGGLFSFSLILGFVPPAWNPIRRLTGERFPFAATAVFYGLAFLYELGVHKLVGKAILKRIHVPDFPRYGNALAETSMPTIMLMLLASAIGPEIALNSPLTMVYFLFIGLSTLRLAAPLSIFTGFVAGVEFMGMAWYYLSRQPGQATFFSSAWPMLAKSVVMAGAGVVCGFVGVQTRHRIAALLESLNERHRVVGMFGKYVSPAVAEQLLQRHLGDAGEVRHVTIMFLDIRNFTTFAEHRTPTEVVEYLNTLFGPLIALIDANHGIVNKFLGDGFMACFGAPLSDGRDTQNAVRAAVDIAAAVERLSAAGDIPATRIGIGLHAGLAVTGSVGSDERKEYTIIGDTVNLASRVEQLTKHYESVLLVTDAVWQVVKDDYPCRLLDSVIVKGRQDPVAIYSVM
jgi:adenylate cyclase